MNYDRGFEEECRVEMLEQSSDPRFQRLSQDWLLAATKHKYSYHFTWLGRPIIQFPQDILAMQEIIWEVKPDLIIETGIAHGGSLVLSAAMLELNSACGGPKNAEVLGIDIEIRPHNRREIEQHPMVKRISMIEGSSVAPEVIEIVRKRAEAAERVLVCLDSSHTHSHVLNELQVYAPLVSLGSYCVVFDTIVEEFTPELLVDRSWGPGNSPMTAVWEFLEQNEHFEVDHMIDAKLAISVANNGYLKRVK